jgi:hypothetical protein
LAASIENPLKSPQDTLMISDFKLMERPNHLHIGLRALLEYHEKHGSLPGLNNEDNIKEVLEIAKRINEDAKKVISKIIIFIK